MCKVDFSPEMVKELQTRGPISVGAPTLARAAARTSDGGGLASDNCW
jgi:hypothetical protein